MPERAILVDGREERVILESRFPTGLSVQSHRLKSVTRARRRAAITSITVIGEAFPDLEAAAHSAAARDLVEALGEAAPRGCSSRLLLARDREVPELRSPRASVERVPLNANALPIVWRTGATARPLDGEFVHSLTPLVPLRSHSEDDGTQTSVMVPHVLAWEAPELLGNMQAKFYRSYVKRALRLADVVLTHTHAAADVLRRRYGDDIVVQVLPPAAPTEYLAGDDAAARREALGLPSKYVVTSALPGEHGRLGWLLEAMEADESLPALVVVAVGGEELPPVRESLRERVFVVQSEDLADVGAVLDGAMLLALPQSAIGSGYELVGALAASVPVLYGECAAAAELALDAGVCGESEDEFVAVYKRLTGAEGADELARLRLFAEDRGHTFSWSSVAWQLWELHANL